MNISGIEVLETLEDRVAPAHTALLVIDMQNDYCSPGGAGDKNGGDVAACRAIVPALVGLLDAARRAGVLVVFTRYTVGPGLAGVSGPEFLRRRTIFQDDRSTIRGSWGHDLIAELTVAPEADIIIDKRRPSSFVGTDLNVCLRCRGVKTLVITGVATSGCVESTVRDAVGLDYYVAVPEDCVASPSGYESHRRSVESMRAHLRYAEGVTTSDRITHIWS